MHAEQAIRECLLAAVLPGLSSPLAELADVAIRIEAARWLTYRAAYLENRGRVTTRESAMAKLFSSETAVRVAEDGVQIHGGYGFVKDYPRSSSAM